MLFAYALEAPTKTKPWQGHNFHAGLPLSVLSCPPRHLSHHHSITVCLHYLRSWMNRGSGLSLGSSRGPALPCIQSPPSLPPSLPNCPCCLPQQPHPSTYTQTHTVSWSHLLSPTHINWSHERVCYFSPLLIFGRYWGLLWLITPPSGHHQLFSRQRCCTWAMLAAVDLLRPELWRRARIKMWGEAYGERFTVAQRHTLKDKFRFLNTVLS